MTSGVDVVALQRLLETQAQRERARRSALRLPGSLLDVEAGTFSQHGEDGVIEAIFGRLDGRCSATGSFVEIGSGDGAENCTRALVDRGWTGIWSRVIMSWPITAGRSSARATYRL